MECWSGVEVDVSLGCAQARAYITIHLSLPYLVLDSDYLVLWQFFSEEVLRTSSSILKDLLSNSIYPSLLISPPPASLAQLCHSATYQLSSLSKVLSAVESEIVLSEDTVIGLIPITVGPFFAQGNLGEDGKGRKKGKGKAGEEKGKEGLKEIRLEALAVLRAVSSHLFSYRSELPG